MSKNYKDTLHLPKTAFPMKADLVKREPEMLEQWESEGLYEKIQAARSADPKFILHDGPPFANGDVHMGTALNKVLKDMIVKSKTMFGFQAPYIPGWDCHGLPIEFKVVKESRGLSPLEVRKRSEAYARKYIDIQRGQFKRLGVLGDWDHPYLTLDPGYEAEILRAFAVFVEKGLVYQSKKPVYWSTGAQTALAEAEVEYADRTDPAIFVKFDITSGELAGKASFVIWTTTPWTLPANVAIALQPNAEYVLQSYQLGERTVALVVARALVAKFCEAAGAQVVEGSEVRTFGGRELENLEAQHPFLDRKSRVILGDFVTLDTGTGAVHIAPGHGADDYVAGMKYGLPLLSPVDDHGKFTDEVGKDEWIGKYVFDANKEVVEFLRSNGTLLGEQAYQHSYPHCWRSKTPVVFRAVEQFFIRIDALRAKALAEIDAVKWIPTWGRNRIYGTVESRPDWCISRQRSWGVPLPIFYDTEGKPLVDATIARKVADLVEQHGTNIWFDLSDAELASRLGLPAGTTRRNDTLDVWIDSGVSHEAVTKKHPALGAKADVYLEATDQHRGWFQSSLMTSIALNEAAPYKTVISHGFVVDVDTRKKISKSEQDGYQKPTNAEYFVYKYGADLVRLWASSVDFTDEVPFSETIFSRVSETYRGIRNTLRILLANLGTREGATADSSGGTSIDHWILAKLQQLVRTCREAYQAYEFHKVYHAINQFCAVELSSIYVDITKDRMYCDALNSPRRRATEAAMDLVLETILKLLAPIAVYTADEAWRFSGREGSVHLQKFPEVDEKLADSPALARVEAWIKLRAEISQVIEQARKSGQIGKALEAAVTVTIPDAAERSALQSEIAELMEFLIVSELSIVAGEERAIQVERVTHARCERCWRHLPTVGSVSEHSDLCERCAPVVDETISVDAAG